MIWKWIGTRYWIFYKNSLFQIFFWAIETYVCSKQSPRICMPFRFYTPLKYFFFFLWGPGLHLGSWREKDSCKQRVCDENWDWAVACKGGLVNPLGAYGPRPWIGWAAPGFNRPHWYFINVAGIDCDWILRKCPSSCGIDSID